MRRFGLAVVLALGTLVLHVLEIRAAADLDHAFQVARQQRDQAVIQLPLFAAHRKTRRIWVKSQEGVGSNVARLIANAYGKFRASIRK